LMYWMQDARAKKLPVKSDLKYPVWLLQSNSTQQ
jgi:hypothetical protein